MIVDTAQHGADIRMAAGLDSRPPDAVVAACNRFMTQNSVPPPGPPMPKPSAGAERADYWSAGNGRW